jgi:hypothetical protein
MITNVPNATYWDPSPILGDRYFVASIDNKEILFALHPDHSVCIALIQQAPVTIETPEQLLAELRGLAA